MGEEEAQEGVDGAKTNYELVVESCARVRRLVASAYELATREPTQYSKEKNQVNLLPLPRLEVITIKEKGNGERIPTRAELDAEYPIQVSSDEAEINSASSVEPDTPYKEAEENALTEDYDKLS